MCETRARTPLPRCTCTTWAEHSAGLRTSYYQRQNTNQARVWLITCGDAPASQFRPRRALTASRFARRLLRKVSLAPIRGSSATGARHPGTAPEKGDGPEDGRRDKREVLLLPGQNRLLPPLVDGAGRKIYSYAPRRSRCYCAVSQRSGPLDHDAEPCSSTSRPHMCQHINVLTQYCWKMFRQISRFSTSFAWVSAPPVHSRHHRASVACITAEPSRTDKARQLWCEICQECASE